jgi:hypothetical protein
MEGEQPVALIEKGSPTQALTNFTACVGAAGREVTVKVTSFEARMQEPVGKVRCRANAFSLAPWREGTAIRESTGLRLSVQEYAEERGTNAFSQTVKLEMTGAFLKVMSTESE